MSEPKFKAKPDDLVFKERDEWKGLKARPGVKVTDTARRDPS